MSADALARRRFLLTLLLASPALAALRPVRAAVPLGRTAAAGIPEVPELRETLAELLGAGEGPARLGRRCIDALPAAERSVGELVARLSIAAGVDGAAGAGAAESAAARLRARVAADYAAERVLTVDGWLLAETEVRLCALACCAPPRAAGA